MRVSVCLCVCVCVCVCVVHVRTVKESLFNLGARHREPVEIDDSDLPQEVHQPAANRNIVNQAHACCLHACVCVCVCVYVHMYVYIYMYTYIHRHLLSATQSFADQKSPRLTTKP